MWRARAFAAFLAFLAMFAMPANGLATVGTTTSSVTVQGNGTTSSFTYQFLIPNSGDISVTVLNTTVTPNVTTTLSASQYSVSGLGSTTGGTVTYPLSGAPLAAGYYLTISRVLPLTQTVSISNQGAFYPEVIEGALDNTVMQIQQLQSEITVLQAQLSTNPPTVIGSAVARVIASGTTDTALTTDRVIAWDSNATSVKTETLYSCNASNAADGPLTIKDEAGTAAVYAIEIVPQGAQTIDGSSQEYVNSGYASVTLTCDGAGNWMVTG